MHWMLSERAGRKGRNGAQWLLCPGLQSRLVIRRVLKTGLSVSSASRIVYHFSIIVILPCETLVGFNGWSGSSMPTGCVRPPHQTPVTAIIWRSRHVKVSQAAIRSPRPRRAPPLSQVEPGANKARPTSAQGHQLPSQASAMVGRGKRSRTLRSFTFRPIRGHNIHDIISSPCAESQLL
jgi:hypothetical protein